jgi:hypothetical protein
MDNTEESEKKQYIMNTNYNHMMLNEDEEKRKDEEDIDYDDENELIEEINMRIINIYNNLLKHRDKLERPLLEYLTIEDFSIFVVNTLNN